MEIGLGQSGASGSVIVNAGGSLTTGGQVFISGATGTFGSLTLNGGSATINGFLAIARSDTGTTSGNGLVNVNAGTLSVSPALATSRLEIGSFSTGTASGTLNITGTGIVTTGPAVTVRVGSSYPGILNVSGTGQLNIGTTGVLNLGNLASSGAIVNLGAVAGGGSGSSGGGTITTSSVSHGASPTAVFNFHGGTLRGNQAGSEKLRYRHDQRIRLERRSHYRLQYIRRDNSAESCPADRRWRRVDLDHWRQHNNTVL